LKPLYVFCNFDGGEGGIRTHVKFFNIETDVSAWKRRTVDRQLAGMFAGLSAIGATSRKANMREVVFVLQPGQVLSGMVASW
jgi:hypothetical protein